MTLSSLRTFFALASGLLVFVGGCTETTTVTPTAAKEPTEVPPDPSGEGSGGEEADAAPAAQICAPTIARKKSKCKNDNAWVRGTAHFDPNHLKSGAKPTLRVVLRHSFVLIEGEEAIGGRLHAYTSVPVSASSLSSGDVPFAIDMCELGTGMWSEENGGFHLLLILDEDGNNDLSEASTNSEAMVKGTPGPNELVKLVDIDISCSAPVACLDVKLDCTGTSCTKVDPVKSCKMRSPGCGGEGFCQ